MKKPIKPLDGDAGANRPLTVKERVRQARHDAYVRAKEQRKNDPRTLRLKEKAKQQRREANARARERRKNDPAQIALKERLKRERQEATRRAKEERKAAKTAANEAERAIKDARLNVMFIGIG